MPGGVLSYQKDYKSDNLTSYLKGFDFRVGTLECAIGTDIPFEPLKLSENGGNDNVCYARDEDFFRLKELGLDAVSLANNHAFDLGREGLMHTISLLNNKGIVSFGAGMTLDEAAKPYIFDFGEYKIALIGCCIRGISPINVIAATNDSYGVYQPSIEELINQIKEIKASCDFVFILPHWGEEHVLFPPYKNVKYSQLMIDAGADGVFGSHSHCISTNIKYNGKDIFFGLGNFLYPDFCMMPPRPFYYPSSEEELMGLDKCINYPKSIKKTTLSVWSNDSRLGMCAEVDIDKQNVNTHKKLVRISNDNILMLNKEYSKVSDIVYRLIKQPTYNLLTRPSIYKVLHKGIMYVSKRKLRYLGDFRKRLV